MTDEERDRLHRRLERLGDMMGNEEHHEEGGEWIEKEYKMTFYTLYPEMRPKKDFSTRDNAISKWCESNRCRRCDGELKQTKKGSLRVVCKNCKTKYQLRIK